MLRAHYRERLQNSKQVDQKRERIMEEKERTNKEVKEVAQVYHEPHVAWTFPKSKTFTRRTTHELTQLCCITHVSGSTTTQLCCLTHMSRSTTTQLCCITHPSGKYYHSVVLYNSPEWKVLPLSYVV